MPGDVARSMATKTDALDSLRAFNRFELKYLVARDQIGDVRADLSERLQPDAHSADGAYSVWSRYYDTADLKFYWEKIDGIRFRRKLRIRHYGSPDQLTPDTPVYVEIKQRVNRVTQKRRIALPYREAVALCDDHVLPTLEGHEVAIGHEVLALGAGLDLQPTAVVGYRRLAMIGGETDGGLRVTFDTYLRGRTSDLELHATVPTNPVLTADLAIAEVKVNERVPYWLTDKIARHNMQLIRISKYCTSVEGKASPGLRLRTKESG